MFDLDSHIFGTLSSIVALKPARAMRYLTKEAGYDESFETVVLPDEFRGMRIRRKTSATSIAQFYLHHKFEMELDLDRLMAIKTDEKMTQNVAHFYALYILSSFVVWIAQYRSDKVMSGFQVLLDSLQFDQDENPATRAALVDAFVDLYGIIIENGCVSEDVLKIVYQFYSERSDLNATAYHCLAVHFRDTVRSEGALTGSVSVQLMNLLNLLVIERPKNLDEQTYLLLKDIIEPFLDEFDLVAMTFYAYIAKELPQEAADEVTSRFPAAVVEFLKKSERFFVLPEPVGDVFQLDGTVKEISYNFAGEDDVKEESTYSLLLENKEQSSLGKICSVAVITRMTSIAKATKINAQLMTIFLGQLVGLLHRNERSEFYLDLLAAFVAYCSMNSESVHIVDVSDVLVKSVIFDPHYTVYDSPDGFDALGAARDYSIELILRQGVDATLRLFKAIASYPSLFAEVCERCIQVVDLLKQLNVSDKSLLRSLCVFEHNFSDHNRYCALARRAMFKLLQVLFAEPSITESLFNDQMFLSYFLASLFNKEERPIILESMTSFMINSTESINNRFLLSIEQIIRQGCQTFPDPRGIQLVCDILNALFVCFDHCRELAPKFWFIVSIFTENAKKIDKTYFDYIFYYLRYLPDTYSSHNINELANAILNDMKLERDDSLYKKLMEVISPDHVTVERPLLIKLLLECFWDEKRDKILDDMIDLCQIQSDNALACSRSGLDVFLVTEMKRDMKYDSKILRLLELIALRISSPVVVHNFIALFRPDENGRPNPNQGAYIQFLNKMILKNYNTPISVLESGISMELSFKSNRYLCFLGWVFNESNSRFEVLNMSDMQVAFVDSNIFIGQENTGCQIPTKKWFLLTLVFQPNEVHLYIDKDEMATVDIDVCYNGKVRVLGGVRGRGRLGSFGFFPALSNTEIASVYQAGPRCSAAPSFPSLVYFTPREIQDFKLSHTKDPEILTFADVLLQTCRIELLLPLFAQFNTSAESADEYSTRIDSVLALFRSVLLIDEEQQIYFAGIRGFSVISHLLLSSSYDVLTFKLYRSFFALSQELKYEALKEQVVVEILLNFELWTRTPELVQIADHWQKHLFPGMSKSTELFAANQLIDWMRLYLWYDKKDDLTRPRNLAEGEVAAVRTSLNKVIAEKYAATLSKYDLVLLLSHCLTSTDVSQVYDNLVLFHDIAEHLAGFVTILESFMGLAVLLLSQDDLIVTTTMSLIAQLHKKELKMDLSLSEHLTVVFHQFKHRSVSETLLLRMFVLIQNDLPEIFEMGSYLAIAHGAEFCRRFYDSLAPSFEYCQTDTWLCWSVYSAVKFEDMDILEFLIKCSCDHWKYIFFWIERACEVSGHDVESVQSDFLRRLTSCIRDGAVPMNSSYVDLVQCFLFSRKGRIHNCALSSGPDAALEPIYEKCDSPGIIDLWNDLVLSSPCLSSDDSRGTLAPEDDIEKLLIQTDVNVTPRVFGLRLDENGKWLDVPLAKESALLVTSSMTEQGLEFLLLAFNFLVCCDKSFVRETMLNTSVSTDLVRRHSEMLNVVKARIEGSPPMTEHILALNKACERVNQDISAFTSQLFQDIRRRLQVGLRKGHYFYDKSTKLLRNYGLDHMSESIEKLSQAQEANTKTWRMIWSHMTMDHAPWNYRENKHHYKRDMIMNYAGCPFVTKINRHFNQYTEAAKMRDSGVTIEPKAQSTIPTHPLEILNEIPKEAPKLVADEVFVTTADCHVVTVKGTKAVKFSLGREMIKIGNKVFKVSDISYVYWRRFKFHLTGIEIFFKGGGGYSTTKVYKFNYKTGVTSLFVDIADKSLFSMVSKYMATDPEGHLYVPTTNYSEVVIGVFDIATGAQLNDVQNEIGAIKGDGGIFSTYALAE